MERATIAAACLGLALSSGCQSDGSERRPPPTPPERAEPAGREQPGEVPAHQPPASPAPPAGEESPQGARESGGERGDGRPGGCVERCVTRNQMRAVGIEVIRADCRRECEGKGAGAGDDPGE